MQNRVVPKVQEERPTIVQHMVEEYDVQNLVVRIVLKITTISVLHTEEE